MSAISDQQRRLICRVLFLLLCLLPSLITLYQIGHPQTPEQWALTLRAELGLETEIGSVETPGPNETILRNLRFFEEGQTLFQTVEARIVYGEINKVIIEYPVSGLNSAGLSRLASRINRQFLSRKSPLSKIWRVEFKEELVIQKTDDQTSEASSNGFQNLMATDLRQLELNRLVLSENARIDIAPNSEGTSVIAYFRVRNPPEAGVERPTDRDALFSETMLFKLNTYHQVQEVELETHNGKLPVWLINGIRPELSASLGQRATFTGQFKLRPALMQMSHLSGIFDQVDISRYERSANSQLATVEIRECRFDEGKFQEWDAKLSSPSLRTTPIYQQHLFQPSRQFAFLPALEEAVQAGRR